jgi:CubicO group peptidase (beta-lactamase class C family)
MLSHTGGVPNTDEYFWHQPEFDDDALERYVRSLASEKMIAAPGERYAYSNPAFEVLGDVIAKVSGQPFESYVKNQILDPLGMQNSTFLRRELSSELATTPHFGAPLGIIADAYPYNRAHAPSSTLHSSATEMCRWMLANLAYGTVDGRRILREASYETLWQPVIEANEDPPWSEVACLSWFRGTYRECPIVHHGGSDPGYWADITLVPEMQFGVMVMANAYCATAWGVADAAVDIMLGLEPKAPRRPITVPVGAALRSGGPEVAIAEYRRLQAVAPDDYDFDEARFNDATWGAIEIHRPEAVMSLLEVWAALSPESPEAFEALGRAYLVIGDLAAAKRSLHTALTLNPDSETIPHLLQRIDGG